MRRKVLILGIGAGNPDFTTVQAIDAKGHVTLFFIPNKGMKTDELARVRAEIIECYVRGRPFRTAPFREPARSDDTAAADLRLGGLSIEAVDASEAGAFLVWSERSLYETVQRILRQLRSMGGFELDHEVIPGNSDIQALAPAHKVALCNIGRSILTATGRCIASSFPNNAESTVFMLDASDQLDAPAGDMHWTLYAGMPDDVLVSGRLRDIVDELERVREEALQGRGWIVEAMLRKKDPNSAS
ncbi:SAM-dependent methyltransferase [Mesorhizobium sp. NPDC059054]|uniref:SAM-dependent methyltransferase n=1 Tax=Mesorhizobium sp. NPDC059054 TaxID=3346711 RepID=UPI0036A91015